jgi:hypothetical protein
MSTKHEHLSTVGLTVLKNLKGDEFDHAFLHNIIIPKYGILLWPEWTALLMSISSIVVATNAVLLKRTEKSLITV